MSVNIKQIRVLADVKNYGSLLVDQLTRKKIEFAESNSVQFQLALAKSGEILDLSTVSTLRLSISNSLGAELILKDVSSYDFDTFSVTEWATGTKHHATVSLTAKELSAISPGEYYFNIQIISENDPIEILDIARTQIAIKNSDFLSPFLTPPVFADQTFAYSENQIEGAVIGTLVVTDNFAGTITFAFDNDTTTSTDGFVTVNAAGELSLTALGVASALNDFEVGSNSTQYTLKATDVDGNTSTAIITLNVTDIDEIAPVFAAQTVQYLENRTAGTVIGSVSFTDNYAVTGVVFVDSGTGTSNDTYLTVAINGPTAEFTMTAAGAASGLNNATDGTTLYYYDVRVSDAAGNQTTATITFEVQPDLVYDSDFTAGPDGFTPFGGGTEQH